MTLFTLDTNCLLAVDESRPEAKDVFSLATAHAEGMASVGLVAISASEHQKSGQHLKSFDEFKTRVTNLGLSHLELLKPMMYWDVTFWDHCLYVDEAMQGVEQQIHQILFSNIEFLWVDYCVAHGLDQNNMAFDKKWRNAKCDVQAYWTHVHSKRDVFVTSDKNFHSATKKTALLALFGGSIETPPSASAMLRQNLAIIRRDE